MNFTLEHQNNEAAISPLAFVKMFAHHNGITFGMETMKSLGSLVAL